MGKTLKNSLTSLDPVRIFSWLCEKNNWKSREKQVWFGPSRFDRLDAIGSGYGSRTVLKSEVDLSHLAGKGVFVAWEKEGVFAKVQLGPHGAVEWPGDVDLCPDALYLRLTGKQPEEVFSGPEGPDA